MNIATDEVDVFVLYKVPRQASISGRKLKERKGAAAKMPRQNSLDLHCGRLPVSEVVADPGFIRCKSSVVDQEVEYVIILMDG